MAWTYSDWRSQATDTARLSRLRLHMDEVGAKVAAAVSDGGASRSTSDLVAYLDTLRVDENNLIARTNGSTGGAGFFRRR